MRSMPVLRWTSYLAPANEDLYRDVAEVASAAAGAEAAFQACVPYERLSSDDFAFLCGLAFVALGSSLHAIAAPVPRGSRYRGRPVYFSDVIVRADSRYRSFSDLRGATFAYNEQ